MSEPTAETWSGRNSGTLAECLATIAGVQSVAEASLDVNAQYVHVDLRGGQEQIYYSVMEAIGELRELTFKDVQQLSVSFVDGDPEVSAASHVTVLLKEHLVEVSLRVLGHVNAIRVRDRVVERLDTARSFTSELDEARAKGSPAAKEWDTLMAPLAGTPRDPARRSSLPRRLLVWMNDNQGLASYLAVLLAVVAVVVALHIG